MQFEVKEGVDNCKTNKVTCKDVDGNNFKEELPIITNNVPHELLLVLPEERLTMAEHFKWFDAINGNQNAKAKLIFQNVGRALKGRPQRKWAKLMKNHHNFTSAAFRDKAQRFIWKVFGEDIYDDQYEFLCKTKMPAKIEATEWINWIEVINKRLPLIDKETEKMTKRKICRKLIPTDIPAAWERD